MTEEIADEWREGVSKGNKTDSKWIERTRRMSEAKKKKKFVKI